MLRVRGIPNGRSPARDRLHRLATCLQVQGADRLAPRKSWANGAARQTSPRKSGRMWHHAMNHPLQRPELACDSCAQSGMRLVCADIIASWFLQYTKYASDFQRPLTLMMSDGTPASSSLFVPPILKERPVIRGWPLSNHTALQRSINTSRVRQWTGAEGCVQNEKRCDDGGTWLLIARCLIRA